MSGVTTTSARGALALGGMAIVVLSLFHPSLPQWVWLEAGFRGHIIAVPILATLLFLAFPFRRRNDLALAMAIVLMGIDLSAHMPPKITFSDAAGAGLMVLQVWTERLRAGARQVLNGEKRGT